MVNYFTVIVQCEEQKTRWTHDEWKLGILAIEQSNQPGCHDAAEFQSRLTIKLKTMTVKYKLTLFKDYAVDEFFRMLFYYMLCCECLRSPWTVTDN